MTLRRLSAVLFALQAALVLAVIVLTMLLSRRLDALNAVRDDELRSSGLAEELRRSSDDLTLLARTFVVTRDPTARARFDAILEARTVDPGLSGAELAKLREARALSDELVKTERAAMDLAATDRERALDLVFGIAYQDAKTRIMAPIDDFEALLHARTGAAVGDQRARTRTLIIGLIALVIVTMVTITGSFAVLRRQIKRTDAADAMLRSAFAAVPVALAIVDLDHEYRFVDVNEAFEQLSGHHRDQVLGANAVELGLYAQPERREGVVGRLRSDGRVRDVAHVLRRKDGTDRSTLLNFEPFAALGRRFAVAVSVDVTEKQRAAAELEQKLAFETLLAEVAGAFLDVSDDDLKDAITAAQGRICAMFDLDRSSVMLPSDGDRTRLPVSQLYPGEKGVAIVGADAAAMFPWVVAQLRATAKPLFIADLDTVDDEDARGDLENFRRIGVRTLLSIPWIGPDGALNGVITFNALRERELTPAAIRQIETLGHMILVALARARERRAVASSQDRNRVLIEMLDEAPAGVLVVDMEGDILYANRQTAVMHGYEPEELAGLKLFDFYPPDRHEAMLQRLKSIVEEGGVSLTAWRVRKDGSRFHAQIRALRTRWGDGIASLSVTTDLTERDRADADIRKLSQAVEQSPEAIAIAGLDHRIEYANEAYLRARGGSAETVRGQPLLGHDAIWEALARGEIWEGELARDGRVERAIYAPVRTPDGEIAQYLAIKQDITDTKRMSEELDRYRKHLEDLVKQRTEELRAARDAADDANQAKSRFLANMSHEIRTPMNAVLGFAQLLQRDPKVTPEQRGHLETINRAGDHLLSLIDGILQLAKVESGHDALVETSFDLWLFAVDLETLFRSRATDRGLRFTVTRDPAVPRFVRADEGKLRQVLSNLLGNAIKFTSRGGVTMRLSLDRERLAVEVEDTGPGIAADEMARLFRDFQQTSTGRDSKQGTGLGLAISRELVRLMGGEIDLRSQVGVGTTFRIDVPVARANEADVASRAAPNHFARIAPDQAAPRVLIADDNEDNRMLLLGLLALVGFETRSCSDGAQAVRDAETWRPQLILMDMRMPKLDGIEAIRRIRATPHGAPMKLVCLTASAFPEDERRAREAGADLFLRKPIRDDLLLDHIAALLGLQYADTGEATPAETPVAPPEVTAASMARLPEALRARLRTATRSADLDGMLAIVDEAAAHDAGLAAGIRALAERYAYKRILELLEAS